MAQSFGARRSLAQAGRIQDDILDRSGLSDVIALLHGQLIENRTLPRADPMLEQAAIETPRAQASTALRARAAGATGGLSRSGSVADAFNLGAAMGSGQLARESLDARRATERFQRNSQILGQLGSATVAGISASPAQAMIQANAMIRSAKIQKANADSGSGIDTKAVLGAVAAVVKIIALL